jgi:hypothetical protein
MMILRLVGSVSAYSKDLVSRVSVFALMMSVMAVSVSTTAQAQVVVTTTGPMAWEQSYGSLFGPSAAGGTFTNNEDILVGFTL